MKFEASKPSFQPIAVILESEEDVAGLFALFNHTSIIRAVGIPSGTAAMLANVNSHADNPPINNQSLHSALNAILKP